MPLPRTSLHLTDANVTAGSQRLPIYGPMQNLPCNIFEIPSFSLSPSPLMAFFTYARPPALSHYLPAPFVLLSYSHVLEPTFCTVYSIATHVKHVKHLSDATHLPHAPPTFHIHFEPHDPSPQMLVFLFTPSCFPVHTYMLLYRIHDTRLMLDYCTLHSGNRYTLHMPSQHFSGFLQHIHIQVTRYLGIVSTATHFPSLSHTVSSLLLC